MGREYYTLHRHGRNQEYLGVVANFPYKSKKSLHYKSKKSLHSRSLALLIQSRIATYKQYDFFQKIPKSHYLIIYLRNLYLRSLIILTMNFSDRATEHRKSIIFLNFC